MVVRDINAECVAVDWLHRHLYWIHVEKRNHRIEVADLDGNYRATLVSDDLLKPRSIAVDPLDGWVNMLEMVESVHCLWCTCIE